MRWVGGYEVEVPWLLAWPFIPLRDHTILIAFFAVAGGVVVFYILGFLFWPV
jgi:hypothetical protein